MKKPKTSRAKRPAVKVQRACSETPERAGVVFRWEQCYEMGSGYHWALCDSQTDGDAPPQRVSDVYMVLLANYPYGMDGRPVGEQMLPALIVRLLNEHFASKVSQRKSGATGSHQKS